MGTITKSLSLLNLFTPDRAEMGLAEFVRLSKRDKATVHRYLTELAENGFLEQNPESRAYRLGPAVLRLSALREAQFPVRKLLRPIVVDLSTRVGELVHASLLEGDALSPLIHADPKLHGVQVHFDITEMLPLHATSSGLAVLAFCPDDMRRTMLSRPLKKHTALTQSDPAALDRIIGDVRSYGLCKAEGTFDDDVTSVGAPLFGEGRRVVGALAVAVPTIRASREKMIEISGHLLRYAEEATTALGGTFPKGFRPLPPDWHDAAGTRQAADIKE